MLTASPGCLNPSVVTVSVCGIRATLNRSASTSTSVRLTPSTATDPSSPSAPPVPAGRRTRSSPIRPAARGRRRGRRRRRGPGRLAAEPVAEPQRPFEVDAVAVAEVAEVGAASVSGPAWTRKVVRRLFDDGEAGAVDGDAFAEGQFAGERGGEGEVPAAGAVGRLAGHGAERFDEAGEHGISPSQSGVDVRRAS